jgi:phosphate transport system substrate-binding protein
LWRRKKRSLNATTESDSNILDSEDNYLFQEVTKETLEAAIPPTTTNNYNGLNGNHSQEDIFPQATAANNLALTQTISPRDQTKEINELDLDYNGTMWDTEAPVIVVNNHYPPIPNIHHNLIDADIPTDEFTNSLLETPESLTPTLSDQKTMSLSELLNRPPAPIREDKYISLSELLGISFPLIHQSPPDQTAPLLVSVISRKESAPNQLMFF